MSGTVFRLSLLLLTMGSMPSSSSAAAGAAAQAVAPFISFAEQPVRLWRDTGVYAAGRGTRLQDGDIVASGAAGIQVEAGATTVALGPATQVWLGVKANTVDFVLLNGWMKIQSGTPATAAGRLVSASAGGMRLSAANSAVILHASLGTTELFVESGEALVEEAQAGTRRQTSLAREQYATKLNAKLPMKLLPRPSKQFLSDMPPVFADRLVPVVAKAGAAAPKLEHLALFAEVSPWLAEEPALRQAIQRRLAPRKPSPPPVHQIPPLAHPSIPRPTS